MHLTQLLKPQQWLLPSKCLGCDRPNPQRLCARCYQGLVAQVRPEPLATTEPLPIWAWGNYVGPVRRAMHQLKYENGISWGRLFGEILGTWWQPDGIAWQVVPIPLSAERQQERGYNQAEEISHSFARWTGLAHCPKALSRVKVTQRQHLLNPSERSTNIQGAFQAASSVKGKSILLVDDIMTTGATLQEAANVLLAAGALRVAAVVVARPQAPKLLKR